jgi:hypothetical protein
VTREEQIAQDLLARLRLLTLVPAANVYRDRPIPLDKDQAQSPAIVFSFEEVENAGDIGEPSESQVANVFVTVHVRALPDPLAACDPIVEEVYATLLSRSQNRALQVDIWRRRVEFNVVDADTDAGEVRITFRVIYPTPDLYFP